MRAEAMRLLWLTEHYYPGRGGMAVACDRIVHGLRKRGARIDVIHLRRADVPPASIGRENGSDRIVPVRPDAPHALAALWASLERENAGWTHVVAFGGALPLAAAPAYAAWLGAPLVTLLRGNDFDTGVYSPERRAFLEDAIRRAARVGCVTEDLRRRVQRLVPGAAAAWTPNGIDLEEWQALPSDRRAALTWRSAHLEPGRRLVGVFGELKAKKGAELFVEAISRAGLAAKLHLLFVGTVAGELVSFFPRGLHTTLLAPMPRTHLIPLLLACDALALPSLYEGFPNLLLEAAALGVPLIASDAGGAGVMREGVHGALFRAGDADDCARAITRFFSTHYSQCERLALEFSAARESETYLQLFAEATGAQPARVAHLASGA